MRIPRIHRMLAALTLMGLTVAVVPASAAAYDDSRGATASVRDVNGVSLGTVVLQSSGGKIVVAGRLSGLTAGFHGFHIHGFPNCFMMSLVHSGFTLNYPYLIDEQARHIAYVISETLARGARTVEATAAAEAGWVETIATRVEAGDPHFAESCTPSYFNNEGKVDDRIRARNFFVGGPTEFAGVLAAWRAEGAMKGLALR